jgi:hypothetical protein
MKRLIKRAIVIVALLIISFVAILYLTRSHWVVLLSIPPDDTIRPRDYCILNPFRDTQPEKLAEMYLAKLSVGEVEAILSYIRDRETILELERKWPIQAWRVGNRQDKAGKTDIVYWVRRGNGYTGEEEVLFELTRTGESWEVESFSAIY